jgi:hypothetical protein
MMFLKNDEAVEDRMNEIGKEAITKLYIGKSENDIEKFITDIIINGNDPMKNVRNDFFNSVIKPPNKKVASENIYNTIRSEIYKGALNE